MIIADDGTSVLLKAGVYKLELNIGVKVFGTLDEIYSSDIYDDKAFSGVLAYDTYKFGDNEPYSITDPEIPAMTFMLRNAPASTTILFQSELYNNIDIDKSYHLYNSALHESMIHDLGVDHLEGVYFGGAGEKSSHGIKNKLNNDEFNKLFHKSEKFRTIKAADSDD